MQYWDDCLFPQFRATIRGEYYGVITQDELDEECFYLAERAISAFKFPRISTEYNVFYATRDEDGVLVETNLQEPFAIKHGAFINTLTYAELEIINAWMKVYWYENQLANADNFEIYYTDSSLKTFSPANLIDKNTKLYNTALEFAKECEYNYGRVGLHYSPTIGDINE